MKTAQFELIKRVSPNQEVDHLRADHGRAGHHNYRLTRQDQLPQELHVRKQGGKLDEGVQFEFGTLQGRVNAAARVSQDEVVQEASSLVRNVDLERGLKLSVRARYFYFKWDVSLLTTWNLN